MFITSLLFQVFRYFLTSDQVLVVLGQVLVVLGEVLVCFRPGTGALHTRRGERGAAREHATEHRHRAARRRLRRPGLRQCAAVAQRDARWVPL